MGTVMWAVRDPATIRRLLLDWWTSSGRDFPWRRTRDPYHILISEVLLHRTRADQVVRVYGEFIRRYPTVTDLARAEPREVMRLLRPLGLRWRVRLLLRAARSIAARFGGSVPTDPAELMALPGIGPYISSAVATFSLGIRAPLLDANTVRVLSRLTGVRATDGSRRSRRFAEIYLRLLGDGDPRAFGYALIDLAALICRPSRPRCGECPLVRFCRYAGQRSERSADASLRENSGETESATI